MTQIEYLLTCLVEECAEVQKETTKILRFGTSGHHPKVSISNIEKLHKEYIDVIAIFDLLRDQKLIDTTNIDINEEVEKKKKRVLKYYEEYDRKL